VTFDDLHAWYYMLISSPCMWSSFWGQLHCAIQMTHHDAGKSFMSVSALSLHTGQRNTLYKRALGEGESDNNRCHDHRARRHQIRPRQRFCEGGSQNSNHQVEHETGQEARNM